MQILNSDARNLIYLAHQSVCPKTFNGLINKYFGNFITRLYSEVFNELLRSKYHKIGSFYSIEDAIQDVMANLHEHFRKFHPERAKDTSIYTSVVNYLNGIATKKWLTNNKRNFTQLDHEALKKLAQKTMENEEEHPDLIKQKNAEEKIEQLKKQLQARLKRRR